MLEMIEPSSPVKDAMAAQSELADFLLVQQQRRRVLPRAILVGVVAGLLATLFRFTLTLGDNVRNGLVAWAQRFPLWGWVLPIGLGVAGAVISVYLVRRFAPEASGSGIPHLESVLHRYRDLDSRRLLPVKFFGGIIALGSGLALGREGPSVQMGGAIADMLARWFKVNPRDRLTLIAAGAGAGLSAAFNAPLAGLMFVLEEVQRDFRPVVFGAAFVAAVSANIVARLLSGQAHSFEVPTYAIPPLGALPVFAILGVIAGLLGVVYNRSLIATQALFMKLQKRLRVALLPAAIVGALVGLVAWFLPEAVGGGHHLAEVTLLGKFTLASIPLWFLLRFVLSMVSYATGAPGGIFAPLLLLGALIGLAVGQVAHALAPTLVAEPGAFAVVGMAAYFTAIVRAPLTGIVLIIEMTDNFEQMLPLAVACLCAYAIAELAGELPIYENLLQRDLSRSGIRLEHEAPIVVEVEVEPHSPFAGKTVRELGLPAGCLLVRCSHDNIEYVPTASTTLIPHMRVTATIAPTSKNGLAALRHGCEAMD